MDPNCASGWDRFVCAKSRGLYLQIVTDFWVVSSRSRERAVYRPALYRGSLRAAKSLLAQNFWRCFGGVLLSKYCVGFKCNCGSDAE